jgi:hypothetical protein
MTASALLIYIILYAQIVPRLQIEPEAFRHAKVVRQAVSDIGMIERWPWTIS